MDKTDKRSYGGKQQRTVVQVPVKWSLCASGSDCRISVSVQGMDVEPERIIIGAGTEYLYGLIIQLLGYDRCYAVEDPGYQKISRIYEAQNVTCKFVAMDESGINIEALEQSGADILHISPAHHFPTGLVTPISRRYELLSWASRQEERYIIEDEYDSEFRLVGKPVPTLESIDVGENVIYINTFSKKSVFYNSYQLYGIAGKSDETI